MLVGEMPVDLADQNAPVLVSKPVGNRHEVDPGHDTLAGEKMSEVVIANPRQLGRLPRQPEGFTQAAGRDVLGTALRGGEEKG